jgi:hypothetical protein
MGITQIGGAHQALGTLWHLLRPQPLEGLGLQVTIHRGHALQVVLCPFLIAGLHIVIFQVGAQQAMGGEDTGGQRDDDGRDVEQLGEAAGMQRPSTAEGDQCELAGVVAASD